MYNQFRNKGLQENSTVKIKKDDFESLARENGVNECGNFYSSEFFRINFVIANEFLNG